MARPLKFDRDKAVEISMNAFWKYGYESCSVKALSEMLGITRSSFYNAFGSQDELFKEALAVYFDQSPDIALTKAVHGIGIKRLFTRTFRSACKARASDVDARGCLVVNSVAELCNVHAELGGVLEAAVLGSLARIEQLLEWGVAQGEIEKETELHPTALALQNLLMGLNVMCKVVRDEQELWKTAEVTLIGLRMFEEDVADENI